MGKMVYKNGDIYEGNWSNNKREGFARHMSKLLSKIRESVSWHTRREPKGSDYTTGASNCPMLRGICHNQLVQKSVRVTLGGYNLIVRNEERIINYHKNTRFRFNIHNII